jgi:uncharacterized protein
MHQRTLNRIGSAAIVGLAVITAAGCSSSNKSGASTTTTTTASDASGATNASDAYNGATIVVAGHGEVTGTPDTMTMSIGVQTSRPSAQDALAQNAAEATALQDTLRTKGVKNKDMQTSNLSISQTYDQHGHITGYSVSNMVTVTLHGLDHAGDVIDAGAAAVGNDITFNGVQLSIDDTSALLRTARRNAVRKAVAHAQQLADAAGVKLGTVRKIDDTGTAVPQPLQFDTPFAANRAASTPIAAGSQQLSVDVALTFAVVNS